MLKVILQAIFGSAFEALDNWLEKRRIRRLEIENIELSITSETMKKGVQDAKKRNDLERELRASTNAELTDRMRDTRERIRDSE